MSEGNHHWSVTTSSGQDSSRKADQPLGADLPFPQEYCYAAELERLNPLIEPRYQRVRRAVLADREPSLERGELTPSSKIVRKVVLEAFKKPVESMFEPWGGYPPSGLNPVSIWIEKYRQTYQIDGRSSVLAEWFRTLGVKAA